MPLEAIDASTFLAASVERVYLAWLDGGIHGAMTGSPATSDPRPGGVFTAWDGFIRGTHVLLEPSRRIVQTWRTTRFDASDVDSRLEVLLDPEGDGTRIRILHGALPAGQGASYAAGWEERYFAPMRAFFAR